MMTSADVINYVTKKYGYSWTTLQSKQRHAPISLARQVAMWLLVKRSGLSYPQVGRMLNRDHTTVIHAINKIDGLILDGKVDLDEQGIADTFVAKKSNELETSMENGFFEVMIMIKRCFRYKPLETLLAIVQALRPIEAEYKEEVNEAK